MHSDDTLKTFSMNATEFYYNLQIKKHNKIVQTFSSCVYLHALLAENCVLPRLDIFRHVCMYERENICREEVGKISPGNL